MAFQFQHNINKKISIISCYKYFNKFSKEIHNNDLIIYELLSLIRTTKYRKMQYYIHVIFPQDRKSF